MKILDMRELEVYAMSDTQIKEDEEATRRQRETQITHEPGHAPYAPSGIGGLSQHAALSLISGNLSARSNMGLRAEAMHQMQRTHGNRAVQRAIQAHTGAARSATLPVQRSPLDGADAYDVEELMNGVDGNVCLPDEEANVSWGEGADADTSNTEGFGDIFGGSTVGGGTPAPPGPNATEMQVLEYQQQMQKYNQMMQIMNNIMLNSNDMRKNIINKLRA